MKLRDRWLFLMPLPAAMILAYLIWAIRFAIWGGLDDVLECSPVAIVWGAQLFPVGLVAIFFVSSEFLIQAALPTVILGYGV